MLCKEEVNDYTHCLFKFFFCITSFQKKHSEAQRGKKTLKSVDPGVQSLIGG